MSSKSKIQWTDATWNPVTGCTKISAGCANCYAETGCSRLKAMHRPKYSNEFQVTLVDLSRKNPQLRFYFAWYLCSCTC